MKKVCVVSGTRADYGLLFWTMKAIQKKKEFQLQTLVTCMHLDPKFGETWKQFEQDGFTISQKIELGEIEDSKESVVNQVSVGVSKFFQAYSSLKPDLVVILGDRYEVLAAAQAAVFAGVPVAHIHGGEITEGAFDDIIRHSVTKMSTYHFTSTDIYRNRVIQMGEDPSSVLNVGAVGLENIRKLQLLNKDELSESLGFQLKEKNFLITYHPVTAVEEDATQKMLEVLNMYPEYGQIITMPNSDPGYSRITEALRGYAKNRKNVLLSTSLGFLRYLSAMNLSEAVIGNSSSGIIEAPFLGTPTLDIGTRQKGRLRDSSVISCSPHQIRQSLEKLLKRKYEKSLLYGNGDSSHKIIEFLSKQSFKQKVGFYDL